MSKIIDEKVCRLCLNNYFPINNIFRDVSMKGCVLYEVLNFVYDLEISRDDGLPPNICHPCLWKVNEFEVYKINVNIAKKKLVDIIRKNSVQKEIDADELVIVREENGSGEIIETEAFYSNANLTEDDTMAVNVMDIPSETDPLKEDLDAPEHCITAEESEDHNLSQLTIKSEIDVDETAIPVKQLEIKKITEFFYDDYHPKECSLESTDDEIIVVIIFLEGKIRLECYHCGEKMGNKEEIAQHIEDAHKSLFNDDDAPHQDQRIHQKQMCTIDEKRYISKSNFVRDVVVHSKEKPFKCTVCSYSSLFRYNLKVHMQKHALERPFKCSICSYSSLSNEHLKIHMRKHTGENPYICDICTFSCSNSRRLREHMQKHTGEKPYVCNICGLSCMRSGHLNVHMRRHTGEKPFKCNICSYRCSQSGQLTAHMRIHTGEKPYMCNICSYSTYKNDTLKVHMRKHTGEKPYQCNICNFRCSHRANFRDHLRRHSSK